MVSQGLDMGPNTATPGFLLRMLVADVLGLGLAFAGHPSWGAAIAGIGTGLYSLHRLVAWRVRRANRRRSCPSDSI